MNIDGEKGLRLRSPKFRGEEEGEPAKTTGNRTSKTRRLGRADLEAKLTKCSQREAVNNYVRCCREVEFDGFLDCIRLSRSSDLTFKRNVIHHPDKNSFPGVGETKAYLQWVKE